MSQKTFILVGFGAIGQAVLEGLGARQDIRVSHVVVRPERVRDVQALVNTLTAHPIEVCAAVPREATLVLECAAHGALKEHIMPALKRGQVCAILSIGALSEQGLIEDLQEAASVGSTSLHLEWFWLICGF